MSDEENDRFRVDSPKDDGERGGERRGGSHSGDEKRKSPEKVRVRHGVTHIFVGPIGRRSGNQITYYANEKELEDKFNEYGKVTEVKVRSNTRDVFAFVHFETSEDARNAIENMNGRLINDTKVKVDWGSYSGGGSGNSYSSRRPASRSYRDSSRDRGHRSSYRRRSPSPRYRRRSPSPRYVRSYRRSPSPRHSRRSPSPRYSRRSPSPRYSRRSPSPRYSRRSPSPYRR